MITEEEQGKIAERNSGFYTCFHGPQTWCLIMQLISNFLLFFIGVIYRGFKFYLAIITCDAVKTSNIYCVFLQHESTKPVAYSCHLVNLNTKIAMYMQVQNNWTNFYLVSLKKMPMPRHIFPRYLKSEFSCTFFHCLCINSVKIFLVLPDVRSPNHGFDDNDMSVLFVSAYVSISNMLAV